MGGSMRFSAKIVAVCILAGLKAKPGTRYCFTFYWPAADQWETKDYTVAVR